MKTKMETCYYGVVFVILMFIAFGLGVLFNGCAAKPKEDPAVQSVRDIVVHHRDGFVPDFVRADLRATQSEFGKVRAWRATKVVWVELTGAAPYRHAKDCEWLKGQTGQVKVASFLLTLQEP